MKYGCIVSVQKIKTAARSNSAFNKQDKRTARTAAVNSNLGIDTDLIGANLDFPKRNKQWTKFFVSIMRIKIRTRAVRKRRCVGEAVNLIVSSSYLGKTPGNPKLNQIRQFLEPARPPNSYFFADNAIQTSFLFA